MSLWPHQSYGLDQIQAAIDSGKRRICVTSPTGGGKSRIMRERIERSGGRHVVYTHRKMLLSQLSEGLTADGIHHGMRASGYDTALLEDVQLAMVQTEQRAVASGRRQRHDAKEAHVDEAHNNANGKTLELIEAHDTLIGYTATPLGIGHLYDHLIVAGTNSQLRECGAHVPAKHYAPSEPGKELIGKVQIGENNTCGIAQNRRKIFAQRVYGDVVKHYQTLNPDRRPTILFAPGVPESIWFCDRLNQHGITAAHIDGSDCYVDGQLHKSDPELRKSIIDRVREGDIQILCNRFVLREGVDIPEIYHCIFATVFGSLTAYLQAGGRVLRSHPSMREVIIQDHGGSWWRHGSLNADREWRLEYNDRIVYEMRRDSIREGEESQPIVCPECGQVRMGGMSCHHCGATVQRNPRKRMVLQANGQLIPQSIGEFRPRTYLPKSEQVEKSWAGRVRAIQRSKKDTVRRMTFRQLWNRFAEDNNWKFAPRDMPMMPVNEMDWFRRVVDVPQEALR